MIPRKAPFLGAALLAAAAAGFFGWRALSAAPAAQTAASAAAVPGFLEQAAPTDEPSAAPSLAPEAEDRFTLFDQSTGETVEVPGRELIPVAVACEMDLSAPPEALKAQAVACYTLFARKRLNREAIPCDSENWLVWTTPERLRERWGEDTDQLLETLETVLEPVYGRELLWEGAPILAAYSAISAGATEPAAAVWGQDLPYLRTVASPGDAFADGYRSTRLVPEATFREAAEAAFPDDPPDLSGDPAGWLAIEEVSPAGYVRTAVLGGKAVTGQELRAAFSLRSAAFTVAYTREGFQFQVQGWGHGVGMSQAGAVFLAKAGAGYEDILAWYYPGAELNEALGIRD